MLAARDRPAAQRLPEHRPEAGGHAAGEVRGDLAGRTRPQGQEVRRDPLSDRVPGQACPVVGRDGGGLPSRPRDPQEYSSSHGSCPRRHRGDDGRSPRGQGGPCRGVHLQRRRLLGLRRLTVNSRPRRQGCRGVVPGLVPELVQPVDGLVLLERRAGPTQPSRASGRFATATRTCSVWRTDISGSRSTAKKAASDASPSAGYGTPPVQRQRNTWSMYWVWSPLG